MNETVFSRITAFAQAGRSAVRALMMQPLIISAVWGGNVVGTSVVLRVPKVGDLTNL